MYKLLYEFHLRRGRRILVAGPARMNRAVEIQCQVQAFSFISVVLTKLLVIAVITTRNLSYYTFSTDVVGGLGSESKSE